MRRFTSAIPRAIPAPLAPKLQDDASEAEGVSFITPEDGDLWQALPAGIAETEREAMPVLLNPGLSPSQQDDLRWATLAIQMGFKRIDKHIPLGFEDFHWDKTFPPDRDAIAIALEPLVARGDDLQEAIDEMYSRHP